MGPPLCPRFEHRPTQLLGRQARITKDGTSGRFYFYDSRTALLAELGESLGRVLWSQDDDELPSAVALDAASVLTALEEKTQATLFRAAEEISPMTTIALGIETACNLSCTYCYNDGHFDRPDFHRQLSGMSVRTGLDAVRGALENLKPGEGLTVQLIGGEPLLQFPRIKRLITEAESMAVDRGCKIRFGMNTNGLGLTDEVIDFLLEHRVGVAISIDGTKEQNDKHRVFRSGRGSYDVLEQRIRRFLSASKAPISTARITAADVDFDFVGAVSHVIGLGFNNVGVGIALGDLLDVQTEGEKRSVRDSLLGNLRKLKEFCVEEYRRGEQFRVSIFNDTMFSLYAYRPKFVPCGAGRRYAGISPNGDAVLCHRYIGSSDSNRIMGNICQDDAGTVLGADGRERFLAKIPLPTVHDGNYRGDDYDCATCWARHLCGGECYEVRDALDSSFEDQKPMMCDLKRGLYEQSIELMVELMAECPALFRNLMSMNAALKPNEKLDTQSVADPA